MAHALRKARQLQLLARHQARGASQAGGGLVQPLMAGIELALHAIAEAACEQIQRSQPDLARLGHQLGRRRGRGSAQVGAKVGDGEVRLVPHPADQGHRALHDGAGQLLVVEGPQVLDGAAPPHQQNDVNGRIGIRITPLRPPRLRQQIQF